MELYNTDCLGENGLKVLADKSIDMILCDLPYGTTANKWDCVLPLEEVFKEYNRIIKDNGDIVLFGSQPFTTDLINANRKYFKYELIWDKNYGTNFLNANRMPLKTHENILVFYKKKPL
jgi:site-specific DNA-methyltransferase (adenine-specific)